MRVMKSCSALGIVLAAGWLIVGCGGGGGGAPPAPAGTITSQINAISTTTGQQGALIQGSMPIGATTGPPAPTLSVGGQTGGVVNGQAGSGAILDVTTATPITDILVGMQGQTGYYDVPVAGAARSTRQNGSTFELVISIPNTAGLTQSTLTVETKDTQGNLSQPASASFTIS